ncbi:MAG TPA: nuclear transport factor 2 family protein [Sphingobacteriaceae bacterium]
MFRLLLIISLLFGSAAGFSQDRQPVLDLLERQRHAWNQGDLEGYMAGYWKSDSLLFVGSRGPSYGWETTLANYRRSYPDRGAMGNLSFDIREVRFLGADIAFVLGAWRLAREQDEPHGFFTLLVRKIKGEWKVVADHSS